MRPLTSLTLALSLGASAFAAERPAPALTKTQWAAARAQQPQRAAFALERARSLAPTFGLNSAEDFVARQAFTNPEGETIVGLDHTFQGHRVWGSRALIKMGVRGDVRTVTKGLRTKVALTSQPTLSADDAIRIAAAHLGMQGPWQLAPKAELVVFPLRFKPEDPILNPVTGQALLNRHRHAPGEPFLAHAWAYEVKLSGPSAFGRQSKSVLVDGVHGDILRVDDLMHHQSAAVGTGNGYYRGAVSIPTTQMPDTTYALWDQTRGTATNPALVYSSQGDGSFWSPIGNQVWYSRHDANGSWMLQDFVYQGNATNTWGDGLAWPPTDWGHEGDTHGQTAGVDAMAAMATTWDLFLNVWNRHGLDDHDTTIFAAVLRNSDYDPAYADQAAFDVYNWGLFLGSGSYDAATRPNGQLSQTDLDVIAHEMTHGVVASTSGMWGAWDDANSEEPGINEGSADFFAQMAKAYATRSAGNDTTIPATGADWVQGAGVNRGTPLRWMNKPSKDGRSVDGWYDGIMYLNGHFSSGVLNRALYFLANGATSAAGDAHSTYLPGGMTGLGNHTTARIWYKAMTENLVGGSGTLTFMDARDAAITAATDIFGAGAEVNAVMDAFAAVNVGDAHNQATPRTAVLNSPWRNGDFLETYVASYWANRQELPMGETVSLRAEVQHNANTQVTWSLGGPSIFSGSPAGPGGVQVGGTLNTDGTWNAPDGHLGRFVMSATSVADPSQMAEIRTTLWRLDLDSDGEQDALDLGIVALNWGQAYVLDPNSSVYQLSWVDDEDVFRAADFIRNAWPVK